MSIPTKIDHVEAGLSRLPSQWIESEKITGLLTSWLNRANELEDLLFEIKDQRSLFDAVGVQLDVLGALFGVDRAGRTDDDYRQAILNEVTVQTSDGTTEPFMQVLRVKSGSDYVDFWEHSPADVHARMGEGFNIYTYSDLEKQVPAGVSLRVMVDDKFDSFVASELLLTTADLQTNNQEDIQVTDGTDTYDLQVQSAELTGDDNETLAVLPEIPDGEYYNPMAELLFTSITSTFGNIIDDQSNFLIDNDGDNIGFPEYSF